MSNISLIILVIILLHNANNIIIRIITGADHLNNGSVTERRVTSVLPITHKIEYNYDRQELLNT